ncbi:Gfo/Idh/MocA family protein, partial [Sphingomonas sp. 37zxx]|uniref:Gfo/Idh/MocA family protein n=1 Tax=Sphingomonas sp. 37zxx TaxID=1550073 RepID=UPI00068972A1
MIPHVLILANSEIIQRRVLPALEAAGVGRIDIASRRGHDSIARPAGVVGLDFKDYADALDRSAASLVWISTVNSLHAELVAAALASGRDVIVDKPATTDPQESLRLVGKARSAGRLLAEATVYAYHPQIAAVQAAFAAAGSVPNHVVAAFSYPPLPPHNFRHDPALGGGALLDLGPYAVSLGRVFFDAMPQRITCETLPGDIGFGLLMRYPGGRTVTGHFGAVSGYVNQATVIGPDMVVSIDRLFTTAPDAPASITARLHSAPLSITVPPADAFLEFLVAVFAARGGAGAERFGEDMAADA